MALTVLGFPIAPASKETPRDGTFSQSELHAMRFLSRDMFGEESRTLNRCSNTGHCNTAGCTVELQHTQDRCAMSLIGLTLRVRTIRGFAVACASAWPHQLPLGSCEIPLVAWKEKSTLFFVKGTTLEQFNCSLLVPCVGHVALPED